MATPDSRSKEIINRLDMILIQNTDSPQEAAMQRVAVYTGNVDITTDKILTTINNAFAAQQKSSQAVVSLFSKWKSAWSTQQNKIIATYNIMRDTIVASLDFNSHFNSIKHAMSDAKAATERQFKRMAAYTTKIIDMFVWSNSAVRKAANAERLANKELHGYLEAGSGNEAPLTVGWVSGLFQKIMLFDMMRENRNRSTELMRWKSTAKFHRTLSKDVRAMLKIMMPEQLTAIQKAMNIAGAAFKWLGTTMLTYALGMRTVSASTGVFGKMYNKMMPHLQRVIARLGGASGALGHLLINFKSVVGGFLKSAAKSVFMGIARTIGMLLNPVVLIGLIAGYGFYKIFEEEFDKLFGALKNLFGDPEKRAALLGMVGDYFNGLIDTIKDFFGFDTKILKDVGAGAKSAVDHAVGWFGSYVDFMVNNVNTVIGGFRSIPDAFNLLFMGIKSMILSAKESVAETIRMIPGGESLLADTFLDKSKLAGDRSKLTEEQNLARAKIESNMNTDYVRDTAVAVAKTTRELGSAIYDEMAKPIQGLTNIVENLDKAAVERIAIQAEAKVKEEEEAKKAKSEARAAKVDAVKKKALALAERASKAAEVKLQAAKASMAEQYNNMLGNGGNGDTNVSNATSNTTNIQNEPPMSSNQYEYAPKPGAYVLKGRL